MKRQLKISILFAAGLAAIDGATQECSSFTVDRGSLDLSPLPGFVEVCSRDQVLCATLTSGYPRSVRTVGYFVREEEWQDYVTSSIPRFNEYLIAQVASRRSASDFEELKAWIGRRQGEIPDNTDLPSEVTLEGQVSLGVIGDASDSISIGTLMRLRDTVGTNIAIVASNIMLQLPRHTMSLYVFIPYSGPSDVVRLKAQSEQWIACLRQRNTA